MLPLKPSEDGVTRKSHIAVISVTEIRTIVEGRTKEAKELGTNYLTGVAGFTSQGTPKRSARSGSFGAIRHPFSGMAKRCTRQEPSRKRGMRTPASANLGSRTRESAWMTKVTGTSSMSSRNKSCQ
uniref:Uncharacterized protein n=1 Tax=Chromera velia CCMP2878 TaxID=1169474 RepID=A0A0G4GRV2_9ALVE|eukprot:Cvel_23121.t1-p1 / transcript=Cvel_23121.t1 / gene=Cvel_23121 / organism=Chromera_velia_CCMP2878 / gene_product=hypothetical protein / transcript_product=hypothetical protein / location=Cvel_scaffold2348:20007-22192(+) / protein_length=125 / sequence_SO=supercontig / SO=protein_coding / is_pseudo=false